MVKQDNKLGFLFLKEETIAHVIHEVVMEFNRHKKNISSYVKSSC